LPRAKTWKYLLWFTPSVVAPATTASDTTAAIMQYSIAVAPALFLKNPVIFLTFGTPTKAQTAPAWLTVRVLGLMSAEIVAVPLTSAGGDAWQRLKIRKADPGCTAIKAVQSSSPS
jgi:hypothetical protein